MGALRQRRRRLVLPSAQLDKNDLFPALNLKYAVNPTNSIRFSASRTVTPSLVHRDGTLPLPRVLRFGTNPR